MILDLKKIAYIGIRMTLVIKTDIRIISNYENKIKHVM